MISFFWKPLVFWLDNEDGPRRDYEKQSKRAFTQASRTLQIDEVEINFKPFTTGKDLLQKLTSGGIREIAEIIGCDFGLDDGDLKNGVEAVKRIRAMKYPTEIIVYGAQEQEANGVKDDIPGWYGNVIVCNDSRKVEASINSAAIKALVKWLDKEYLRGLIISRTTNVEDVLDNLLINFYQIAEQMKTNFGTDILQADLLAFGKKISIVEKIVKCIPKNDTKFGRSWKKDLDSDLKDLSNLRNNAAHGLFSLEYGKFRLKNRGKVSEIGKSEIAEHFYKAYDAQMKLEHLLSNMVVVTKYVLDSQNTSNQVGK